MKLQMIMPCMCFIMSMLCNLILGRGRGRAPGISSCTRASSFILAPRTPLSLLSPCRFSALSPFPSRRSSLCPAKSEKYVWDKNVVFLVNCRFWPGTRLPPPPQLPWGTALYPSIIQFRGSNMCVCHSISPQRCFEACLTNSNPEILVLSLSLSSMLLPRTGRWSSVLGFQYALREKRVVWKGEISLFILIDDSIQACNHHRWLLWFLVYIQHECVNNCSLCEKIVHKTQLKIPYSFRCFISNSYCIFICWNICDSRFPAHLLALCLES